MLLNQKQMPTVAAVMRPFPYFAEPETPIAQIIEIMNEHQIRHIPIKKSDRIVGIVSERDLHWLSNSMVDYLPSPEIPVCHIMTYDPYLANINTPLTTVVEQMCQQKIGAAIITCSERLVGIITLIDVCQAFTQLLKVEFSCSPQED